MLIFYKQMSFFVKMYYASEPLSILAFWFIRGEEQQVTECGGAHCPIPRPVQYGDLILYFGFSENFLLKKVPLSRI